MKTNLTYSQINYINNSHLAEKRKKLKQGDFKEQNTREKNTDFGPARAISFGGSKISNQLGSLTNKAIGSLIKNESKPSKFVNFLINVVNENEAAYTAVYSLIVAGMIKPVAVMCMPGSEEKDKQIVATKNFLQAFLGSFLSFTIGGGFIKKAIDVIKNNLKLIKNVNDNGNVAVIEATSEKALKLAQDILKKENGGFKSKIKLASQKAKDLKGLDKAKVFAKSMKGKVDYTPSIDEVALKAEDLINNFNKNHLKIFERNKDFLKELKNGAKNARSNTTYSDAFETLWKNSTGALTSIGKAKISTILLPTVMGFLFAKKNLAKEMAKQEKERQERAKETTLTNNTSFKNQQEQFKQMMNKNKTQVSFSGNVLNKGIDTLAKGVEYVGMSKPGEFLAKLLAKAKKPSARMADVESFAITGYWLQNTARNKKIEPSQKLGLNIHSALVTAVSSTAAFIIDKALDGLINSAKEQHSNKLKSIVDFVKQDENLLESISYSQIDLGYSKPVQNIIKQACLNILNVEDQNKAIEDALQSIKKTKVVKDAIENGAEGIDKNLIKQVLDNLKKAEPLSRTIKEQCGNMIDAKKISDTLTRINLRDDDAIAGAIKDLTGNYGKKLTKFKSLTIFTFVVRFLVPVLMVPVSGKIKRKIVEWQENRTQKA